MAGYLIRRFGTAIVIVLGVTLLTFAMLHIVAPANAAALATLGPKATPAAIKAYDHANGFDRPLIQQYLTYLNRLLHGNLGWSYHFNQSVTALLSEKAPLSAFLSGSSLVLAVVVAIPLGIYQAIKRNTFGDVAATSVTFVLYSMPVFFFAIILIQIFAITLNWVDPGVGQDQSLTAALGNVKDLILPIIALSSTAVAGYSRYQRSSSLDVLAGQGPVRAAGARPAPGAQRLPADDHPGRHLAARADRRQPADRVRLQHQRARAAVRQRPAGGRLQHRAGVHAARRRLHRGRQPDRGHRAERRRPADQAGVTMRPTPAENPHASSRPREHQ
jgi:ABC-type dipeptide/oligopeptide/nickel transport system permease component